MSGEDRRDGEMATRVTDFRIDKVEIWEADYYRLPAEAQRLIEAYASPIKASHPDKIAFEIPIYRWEEINAVLARIGDNGRFCDIGYLGGW